MIRVNFLIDESTFYFLKTLPGTMTEHIRRAITEYTDKLRKAQKISASQSGRRVKKNE